MAITSFIGDIGGMLHYRHFVSISANSDVIGGSVYTPVDFDATLAI
ncbi:MAG: hypothetical protein ABL959_22160 [Pyrinomonadaceae bacterium]